MIRKTCEPELAPPHPGEILREEMLPNLAVNRAELARKLGIKPQTLAELLAERVPVTLEIAQRLGASIGFGTRYWLGLQIQHDLWRAETMPAVAVERVKWRRNPAAFDRPRSVP